MSEILDTQQHVRLVFPLLGDNNFGPWRQWMSDQLKETDLWLIVSGREKAPQIDREQPSDVQAYDKWLPKCYWIMAKIGHAMEPHICAQYAWEACDKDLKALWDKLAEGYREVLSLELYYFRRSLFDCTLEAHGTVAKYLHEIDLIIQYLWEAEEIIKALEKTCYLLNGLLATWREWRDLQAIIIKPDELVVAIKVHEASLNHDQGIACDTVLSVEGKRYAGRAGKTSNRRPEQARHERQNRSSTDKTLTCYYCQKKGHRRSECRKLKWPREKGIHVDHSNSPMPAMACATATLSRSIFTAFPSASASTGQGQWLLDSGCSTQVNRMKEHLSSYVALLTGEQKICVSNKLGIDALGEGEVTLSVWDE